MESYDKIKKTLAVAFMHDLDNNRPEGKMCLSNGECADIEKAFNEQDWPKLARYLDKYTESEDERIRKAIIKSIEEDSSVYEQEVSKEQMLSWLEKQKDQKPTEKQDYSGLTDFERAIHRGFLCAGVVNVPVTIIKETAQDCLAHLPAEWSEEDEKKIHFLSRLIDFQVNDGEYCFGGNHRMVSKQEAIEMLLSLRPQPKKERQIKYGDKVSIHCRKDRKEDMITIYDGKVGEVIHVWDAKRNPWGHIVVRLDNGCNNGFYEDELEVLDKSHWKPSKEEMKALLNAEGILREQRHHFVTAGLLAKLYEQLKKL